jgi:hypothetical protein
MAHTIGGSPSRICTHGYRTCNQCSPDITDRNNLTTRNKKEKGTFYGYTAAGFLALEDKEKFELTSNYKDLQGRAEIESGKEGKRSLLRSAKEQV